MTLYEITRDELPAMIERMADGLREAARRS